MYATLGRAFVATAFVLGSVVASAGPAVAAPDEDACSAAISGARDTALATLRDDSRAAREKLEVLAGLAKTAAKDLKGEDVADRLQNIVEQAREALAAVREKAHEKIEALAETASEGCDEEETTVSTVDATQLAADLAKINDDARAAMDKIGTDSAADLQAAIDAAKAAPKNDNDKDDEDDD